MACCSLSKQGGIVNVPLRFNERRWRAGWLEQTSSDREIKKKRGVREEAEALCCVNVTLSGNGLRTLRPTLVANRCKEWEQMEEGIPCGDALAKRTRRTELYSPIYPWLGCFYEPKIRNRLTFLVSRGSWLHFLK